jgi:hypothetical protein
MRDLCTLNTAFGACLFLSMPRHDIYRLFEMTLAPMTHVSDLRDFKY